VLRRLAVQAPEPDRLVGTRGRQGPAVRTDRDRPHTQAVALERSLAMTGGRIPEPDTVVAASRDEESANGAEGDGGHGPACPSIFRADQRAPGSQIRMLWSWLAEARNLPSELKETSFTPFRCPSRDRTQVPEDGSQILTLRSALAEASDFPSG